MGESTTASCAMPARSQAASESPVAAAVRSNTLMTDVPWAPAKRLSSPQMTSAATRPCLFAGPASEMSASSPVTRWLTCTASPTA